MIHIQIVTDNPTKYVFVNDREDPSLITVTDINEIINSGIPIDPKSGDDLEYVGPTTNDVPVGMYRGEHPDCTISGHK